jgi:predicted Rdx family selenoprotein
MARLDLVIRYHMMYEDEALGLARRLFARFDEAIDSLILMPVADDDFSLSLNGQLVHSQRQSGTAPRAADIVALRDGDPPLV